MSKLIEPILIVFHQQPRRRCPIARGRGIKSVRPHSSLGCRPLSAARTLTQLAKIWKRARLPPRTISTPIVYSILVRYLRFPGERIGLPFLLFRELLHTRPISAVDFPPDSAGKCRYWFCRIYDPLREDDPT